MKYVMHVLLTSALTFSLMCTVRYCTCFLISCASSVVADYWIVTELNGTGLLEVSSCYVMTRCLWATSTGRGKWGRKRGRVFIIKSRERFIYSLFLFIKILCA
jgi:hypothetical protein